MPVRFQLVIDCADPDALANFWAAALGYVLEPPPAGFATWNDYWREVGVPEDELFEGADCIVDPEGVGPRIWFQVVPDVKSVKNRLHLDIHASGGQPERAHAMASQIPMQRAGTALEVAQAIVWLLGHEASYTTGAILDVSGGR